MRIMPISFRHRLAHPSLRPIRHRRHHRRRPQNDPDRSVPHQPGPLRSTTPTTDPAPAGLDQPTPTSPIRINSTPLVSLDLTDNGLGSYQGLVPDDVTPTGP